MDRLKAEKIALLRDAKQQIDDKDEQFICFAIGHARNKARIWRKPGDWGAASEQLQDFIEASLPIGCNSVAKWLDHTHFNGVWHRNWMYSQRRGDLYALCRMAWIDKMIDDLKNGATLI